MNNQIERPIFFENQVLGAADLTAAVEHSRAQQARHERYFHLWGIASGLELSGKEKQTAQGDKYQEITLSAGIATDGTGREVVVPEAEQLSRDLFDQLNVAVNDKDAWYPVFLIGRDEPAPQPPLAIGTCQSSLPTRKVEGHEVTFGRPGEELDLDIQGTSTVAEGPGSGEWKVLLGFVQWDAEIKNFKAVSKESDGIGRRHSGVQADVVAARDGRLTFRTRPRNEAGKPAVMINETGDWLLQFGKLTAQGAITSVFSVNEKGDIKAEGTIKAKFAVGSVQIQSGVATDGVVLPLPPGITEEQVAAGQVTLHIQLTPLLPGAFLSNAIDVPFECEIEPTTRRVLSRFRRVNLGPLPGGAPTFNDLPGACHFTVLASVPVPTGG
jgi:hypothetical protein